MPNFNAIFLRHMKKAIRDLPALITVDGETYKTTATNVTNGDALMVEGVRIEEEMYFACLVADFDNFPTLESRLTYDGVEYRIKRLDKSQDGLVFYIFVENVEA